MCDSLPTIPFHEWLARVRAEPDLERNPAGRLLGFLEGDFMNLGVGSLMLDTRFSREVSKTLRHAVAVDEEMIKKYVAYWASVDFL